MNDGRKKDVTRRVVVDLKKVEGEIPRNAAGDPWFTSLCQMDDKELTSYARERDVLSVFSPEQVVALVNRALYQMEYSRTIHRERSQQLRDREKPVREAAKRLFPSLSWSNLSEEQLKQAVNAAYPPKEVREK